MKLNVRTLTSIVMFITLYTACVVLYLTYGDQQILLKGERKINNRTTLIRKKWSHRKRDTLQAMTDDEKDNIIRHLQKRVNFLLRELNSIKNKCNLQEERDDTVPGNEDLESNTRLNNGQVIAKADFLTPLQSTNDVAYNMFSAEKLYQVNSIARPSKVFTKESFQRQGKHEHLSRALDEAKIFLKKSMKFTSNVNLTLKTGLFRENANLGVQYEIHLEAKSANRDETYGVTLAQPLSPFILLSPPVKTNLDTLVNIIVPLQGRLERFEEYLHHFKSVCLQRNENVHLTVVYSGEKGVKTVLKLLNNLREETNFTNFNLLTKKESFNRGQLLHVAATQWKNDENVLMFFCDVDISFEPDFLERCRLFTKPAGSVYFPIVFNYYNPYYVRQETDKLWKICKLSKGIFTKLLV